MLSTKAFIALSLFAGVVAALPSSSEDRWLQATTTNQEEPLVGAGGKVAFSYSDCSGGKMHVKVMAVLTPCLQHSPIFSPRHTSALTATLPQGVKVAFSPKQPSLGDTLTVTASGKLDEVLTGGTYSFKAKKLGITLASHTDTVGCLPAPASE